MLNNSNDPVINALIQQRLEEIILYVDHCMYISSNGNSNHGILIEDNERVYLYCPNI